MTISKPLFCSIKIMSQYLTSLLFTLNKTKMLSLGLVNIISSIIYLGSLRDLRSYFVAIFVVFSNATGLVSFNLELTLLPSDLVHCTQWWVKGNKLSFFQYLSMLLGWISVKQSSDEAFELWTALGPISEMIYHILLNFTWSDEVTAVHTIVILTGVSFNEYTGKNTYVAWYLQLSFQHVLFFYFSFFCTCILQI